jgi:hypothetical protein
MVQFTQVSTVLRVLPDNFVALSTGCTLVAISRSFVREGQQFVLVGSDFDSNTQEQSISFWAVCDSSTVISGNYDRDYLSRITRCSEESVQKLLDDKSNFLLFLRVYKIPVETKKLLQFNKQFAALPSPIAVVDEFPVIADNLFCARKNQISNGAFSAYSELEKLQKMIVDYTENNPKAKRLDDDIKCFLGWVSPLSMPSSPDWIKEITTSGNSSDGYLFEKLVRQAFIYLGFTNNLNNPKASLDPNGMGGAGGIDVYCEKPFPIVGECKASRFGKVGNGVCAQLINNGNTNLGKDKFESAVKIIFAAGKLNNIHAEPAAKENKMNVMRPDTLQRLVELKIAYPGSIDLLKLEPCLNSEPFGTDADKKVNDFIDQIEKTIKLRSHVVKTFKKYLEETKESESGIEKFSGFFSGSNSPEKLKDRELYNILIELSSPLSGYLGRNQCDVNWKGDRFYYLRDLILPTN